MRPVPTFLVVTFAVGWGAAIPASLVTHELVSAPSIVRDALLGVFLTSPAIGALAVANGSIVGRVRRVLSFFKRRQVPRRAYLAAIAIAVIGVSAEAALMLIIGAPVSRLGGIARWVTLPLTAVATLVAAALEEVGWRGVLFARIRERRSFFGAALLVGIAWGIWHVPLLIAAPGINAAIPIWVYPTLALAFSVVLGWLFELGGGAVTVPALSHGLWNALAAPLIAASHDADDLTRFYVSALVVAFVGAATIVVSTGRGRKQVVAHSS